MSELIERLARDRADSLLEELLSFGLDKHTIERAIGEAIKVTAEECAKVCEEQADDLECPERAQYCAEAIRAKFGREG